jgi:hypothetical protein
VLAANARTLGCFFGVPGSSENWVISSFTLPVRPKAVTMSALGTNRIFLRSRKLLRICGESMTYPFLRKWSSSCTTQYDTCSPPACLSVELSSRNDKQMGIDRWLLIAVDVLLPLWILVRIVTFPALLNGPGHSRLLTTYMQYRAEQRRKPPGRR